MKILFLINSIPPDYGGGYLRTFKTAARFKNDGLLYKIMTFTKKSRYNDVIYGITDNDILFFGSCFFASFCKIPFFMLSHRRCFDVFYVASIHWFTVIPVMTAKLLKKKVVIGVTLSMVDSPANRPNALVKCPYYWFKNSQFKMTNYLFVNSPLLVEECKSCGFGEDVVKLINNPVDTKVFYPVSPEEKNAIKTKFDIEETCFTIVFIGSFNKRKGCDLLPELFKKLFSRLDSRVTFVMCGQKGYPETDGILADLKKLFDEYGNKFVVEEEVRNTAPYYQMADIFLFPTTNEGMPNVVLEAMASECMIISNLLPGITDYVLPKECLVYDNDVEEYVNKILDYYYYPRQYENAIKQNRISILKSFSIESVDKKIKNIIQ